MTPDRFIATLKAYYGKELDGQVEEIYQSKLLRFSDVNLKDIHEKVLETCKFFPKVSDIYSAASDLGINISKSKKQAAQSDCQECKGTGCRQTQSFHAETGEPYDSVRRCECTGLPHPEPSGKGPGGYVLKQDGTP